MGVLAAARCYTARPRRLTARNIFPADKQDHVRNIQPITRHRFRSSHQEERRHGPLRRAEILNNTRPANLIPKASLSSSRTSRSRAGAKVCMELAEESTTTA
jgi:hypothetical protein